MKKKKMVPAKSREKRKKRKKRGKAAAMEIGDEEMVPANLIDQEEGLDDPVWHPDYDPDQKLIVHLPLHSPESCKPTRTLAQQSSSDFGQLDLTTNEQIWVKVGKSWEKACVQDKKEGKKQVKWLSTGSIDWVAADSCQTQEQYEKAQQKGKRRKSRSVKERLLSYDPSSTAETHPGATNTLPVNHISSAHLNPRANPVQLNRAASVPATAAEEQRSRSASSTVLESMPDYEVNGLASVPKKRQRPWDDRMRHLPDMPRPREVPDESMTQSQDWELNQAAQRKKHHENEQEHKSFPPGLEFDSKRSQVEGSFSEREAKDIRANYAPTRNANSVAPTQPEVSRRRRDPRKYRHPKKKQDFFIPGRSHSEAGGRDCESYEEDRFRGFDARLSMSSQTHGNYVEAHSQHKSTQEGESLAVYPQQNREQYSLTQASDEVGQPRDLVSKDQYNARDIQHANGRKSREASMHSDWCNLNRDFRREYEKKMRKAPSNSSRRALDRASKLQKAFDATMNVASSRPESNLKRGADFYWDRKEAEAHPISLTSGKQDHSQDVGFFHDDTGQEASSTSAHLIQHSEGNAERWRDRHEFSDLQDLNQKGKMELQEQQIFTEHNSSPNIRQKKDQHSSKKLETKEKNGHGTSGDQHPVPIRPKKSDDLAFSKQKQEIKYPKDYFLPPKKHLCSDIGSPPLQTTISHACNASPSAKQKPSYDNDVPPSGHTNQGDTVLQTSETHYSNNVSSVSGHSKRDVSPISQNHHMNAPSMSDANHRQGSPQMHDRKYTTSRIEKDYLEKLPPVSEIHFSESVPEVHDKYHQWEDVQSVSDTYHGLENSPLKKSYHTEDIAYREDIPQVCDSYYQGEDVDLYYQREDVPQMIETHYGEEESLLHKSYQRKVILKTRDPGLKTPKTTEYHHYEFSFSESQVERNDGWAEPGLDDGRTYMTKGLGEYKVNKRTVSIHTRDGTDDARNRRGTSKQDLSTAYEAFLKKLPPQEERLSSGDTDLHEESLPPTKKEKTLYSSSCGKPCQQVGCQSKVPPGLITKLGLGRRRRRRQRSWVLVADFRRCPSHLERLVALDQLFPSWEQADGRQGNSEAACWMEYVRSVYATVSAFSAAQSQKSGDENLNQLFNMWSFFFNHPAKDDTKDEVTDQPVHHVEEGMDHHIETKNMGEEHGRANKDEGEDSDFRTETEINDYISSYLEQHHSSAQEHFHSESSFDLDNESNLSANQEALEENISPSLYGLGDISTAGTAPLSNGWESEDSETNQFSEATLEDSTSLTDEVGHDKGVAHGNGTNGRSQKVRTWTAFTKCQSDGCLKFATHNFAGEGSLYCEGHKEDGMEAVAGVACDVNRCRAAPSFAWDYRMPAVFCPKHRLMGMLPTATVLIPPCRVDGCGSKCTWGVVGVGLKACENHADQETMVKMDPSCICKEEGCKLTGLYTQPGEDDGAYCSRHAPSNARHLWRLRCAAPTCDRLALTVSKDKESGEFQHGFCSSHHSGGTDLEDLGDLPSMGKEEEEIMLASEEHAGLQFSRARQRWELVSKEKDNMWHQRSTRSCELAKEFIRYLGPAVCEEGSGLCQLPDQLLSIPGVVWDKEKQSWVACWVGGQEEEEIAYSAEENGFVEARLLAESARLSALIEGANFKISPKYQLHPFHGFYWCVERDEYSANQTKVQHKKYIDGASCPNYNALSSENDEKIALCSGQQILSCPVQFVNAPKNKEQASKDETLIDHPPDNSMGERNVIYSGIPGILWLPESNSANDDQGCWKITHMFSSKCLNYERVFSCSQFGVDASFQMALAFKQYIETFKLNEVTEI